MSRAARRAIPRALQADASALHHTILTLGTLTILSSLSFWTLRPNDRENVSKGAGAKGKGSALHKKVHAISIDGADSWA